MTWLDPLYDFQKAHRTRALLGAMWASVLFFATLVHADVPFVGQMLNELGFFTMLSAPLFVGVVTGFELAAVRNGPDGDGLSA